MSVSDRDFELLQDEVKCLRKKMSSKLSTAGGYVSGSVTIPGSSVYPNEYLEDCSCDADYTFEDVPCDSTNTTPPGLGDLIEPPVLNGMFIFDAINGIFYKPPLSDTWENRNVGLTDSGLEHGTVDPWWYRKTEAVEDNAIIWRCGLANIKRSANAGRLTWKDVTPTGTTALGTLTYHQIFGDPFQQNWFYSIASSGARTFLFRTKNDGQVWDYLELTTYNGVSSRLPIWLTVSTYLWVSTWGDGKLRLLKINNDDIMTISSEYDFGNASYFEMENKYNVISPECTLDDSTIFVYGRFNHPTMGLTHVAKTEDEGISWSAIEKDWGMDWCGSFHTSLKDSNNRVYYSVRNTR